jgi:flagellar hook-basal body complex protein FliE
MGALPETAPKETVAFAGMLVNGVNAVNSAQLDANAQVHALMTGEDVTQAEVLSSVQKADMAFRLLIQVRNKLMSAYEELNSIRV